MAYNTDPRLLAAIRQQPAHLQPVLLATTWAESEGRLDAVGDGGRSHGPYQMHDEGRGRGVPVERRRDPAFSTQAAAREFQQYFDRGARGGQLAARAQRPLHPGAYATKVESLLDDARRALAGQPTSTARESLGGVLGGQQSQPQVQGQRPDIGAAIASGLAQRPRGQSLARTVVNSILSTAMTAQGAPASNTRETQQVAGPGQSVPGEDGIQSAARRYVGTPYSWGGGSPSGPTRGFGRGAKTVGFDCSSLVQYIWAQNGKKIPRTTYEQIKIGQPVNAGNPQEWQVGDLLFPHTGHVVMYLGNGKVAEAPRTGGHVQIVPARGKYLAVRRP